MHRILSILLLAACADGPSTDAETDDSDAGLDTGLEVLPADTLPDDLTVWTFAGDDPLTPLFGDATLQVWDPDQTGWADEAVVFAKASEVGAPLLDGVDVSVLSLPALTPSQALALVHNAQPNGTFAADGRLSRYTLLLDVFVPADASGIATIYQADTGNVGPGELQLTTAGIGTNFQNMGDTPFGEWHRIAWTIRAALGEGQAHRVVDGTFVGGIGTTGSGLAVPYAPTDSLLMFTDGLGTTLPLVVASIGFVPEAVDYAILESLGQPTAGGVHIAGAPGEPLDLTIAKETLNFSHRGDSCCAPENTLLAVNQGFAKGADHQEVDVRVTQDGVVVLFHDATLDRTTDGTGLIADKTYDEIKDLDAGSWFGPQFAGEPIPTLAEVLVASKGKGRLYLDIKTANQAMADGIQDAIEEADVGPDALWIWASESQIDTLYSPAVDDARYLLRGTPPDDTAALKALQAKGVEGFSFGSSNVNASLRPAMEKAQALGLIVECFTILDPYRMAQLSAFGVSGMENDFPGVFDRYREE